MRRKLRKAKESQCFRHKFSMKHKTSERAHEVIRLMVLKGSQTKGLHPVYCKDCKGYYLENLEHQHGTSEQAKGSTSEGNHRLDSKERASGEREDFDPDDRIRREAERGPSDDSDDRRRREGAQKDSGWKANPQDLFGLFEV